jgi:hypothetical protein
MDRLAELSVSANEALTLLGKSADLVKEHVHVTSISPEPRNPANQMVTGPQHQGIFCAIRRSLRVKQV